MNVRRAKYLPFIILLVLVFSTKDEKEKVKNKNFFLDIKLYYISVCVTRAFIKRGVFAMTVIYDCQRFDDQSVIKTGSLTALAPTSTITCCSRLFADSTDSTWMRACCIMWPWTVAKRAVAQWGKWVEFPSKPIINRNYCFLISKTFPNWLSFHASKFFFLRDSLSHRQRWAKNEMKEIAETIVARRKSRL